MESLRSPHSWALAYKNKDSNMKLEIKWYKPLKLKDGSIDSLIYKVDGLDEWIGCAGVYMFCRKYGDNICPLYIGKAESLGARIKQHLNSIKLMKGIENSQNGGKVLIFGELLIKSGQEKKKSITLIEKALIEHALSEGFELLNIQGTKTPTHSIEFSGYQLAKNMSGSSMLAKAKKG
jgi:hypothetical protein